MGGDILKSGEVQEKSDLLQHLYQNLPNTGPQKIKLTTTKNKIKITHRTLCRPGRLWGPPNLLYNGYRELFPGGKAAGA
jgi:hypothetical protein